MSLSSLADYAKVPPERMTGRARLYLLIACIRHVLVAVATWVMAGQFTSPAFDQIKAILPLPVWGILFAVAGLACGFAALFGHETLARVGLILSSTSSALWAGGFLAAALSGQTTSPTGVIIWWAVALKDLVMCGQPLRSPFEPLMRMFARPERRTGDAERRSRR